MTSNLQIDNFYRNEPLYGGCFSKDELRNRKPAGKFYIINLQDSDAGGGTHWVAVIDFLPKKIIYFDAFGVYPPTDIVKFMLKSTRKEGKEAVYSKLDYQELSSSKCGEYCVLVANSLLEQLRTGRIDPVNFDRGLLDGYPSQRNERVASRVRL